MILSGVRPGQLAPDVKVLCNWPKGLVWIRIESHGPFLDCHDHLGGHDDYNVKNQIRKKLWGKEW